MKTIRSYAVVATTCLVIATPMFVNAAIKTTASGEQAVITYTASDLNQPGGLEQLDQAVRKAAEKVCGADEYSETKSIQTYSQTRACVSEAVDDAMKGIGELQVTSS